jgi:hypothetical protein
MGISIHGTVLSFETRSFGTMADMYRKWILWRREIRSEKAETHRCGIEIGKVELEHSKCMLIIPGYEAIHCILQN